MYLSRYMNISLMSQISYGCTKSFYNMFMRNNSSILTSNDSLKTFCDKYDQNQHIVEDNNVLKSYKKA